MVDGEDPHRKDDEEDDVGNDDDDDNDQSMEDENAEETMKPKTETRKRKALDSDGEGSPSKKVRHWCFMSSWFSCGDVVDYLLLWLLLLFCFCLFFNIDLNGETFLLYINITKDRLYAPKMENFKTTLRRS